jgi:rhamnulokinase
MKYRWVLTALEHVTGRPRATSRIGGGGSQPSLLGQVTADGCGRRKVTGPAEATALGNILVQAVALGIVPDSAAGREAVARSGEPIIDAQRVAAA